MLAFLWILGSFGVGYAAKTHGRNWVVWCVIALLGSPLVGAVALMLVNRFDTPARP